jgi:uncharacterized membrane protein YebE (DUF533 family)
MFDAKTLLDALVGASARPGMPPDQPQKQGGTPDLGSQVGQAVGRLTGQSTDQLLQKAKDVLAQNPGLAQAGLIGLAGLLFGKRKSGGMSGNLAKLGGLAVIGGLAYKAFRNHQSGRPLLDMGGAGPELGATQTQGAAPETLDVPQESGFHPASQTEDDVILYLRTMVAAAAADGQIDEAERSRIARGLTEGGIDAEATRWLEREMADPADVEDLAAKVNLPEKAAQVYAAARIAIDPDTIQEREFLRQLAEALNLDPALKAQIDESAGAAKVS